MTNPFMDLSTGDTIIVTGGISNVQHLTTVTRVTKTQVVVPNGTHFRKKDGYQVGSQGWHPYRIVLATTENRAKQIEWQQKQDWKDMLWEIELVAQRLKGYILNADQTHLIRDKCNQLIQAENSL